MKVIKKDSWHYRFISKRYRPSPNACPYIRQFLMCVIATVAIYIIIGSVCFGGAVLVVAPLAVAADQFYHFTTGWSKHNVEALQQIAISGSMVYAVAGVVGLIYVYTVAKEKYDDYRIANPSATPYVPKEPSIVTVWLRDLHNKTCTPLKFE